MKFVKLFVLMWLSFISTVNAEPSVDPIELEKREAIMPMMPSAPEGYSWKAFYGIGVLCPNTWTFTYPTGQEAGTCLNPDHPETVLTMEIFTVTGDNQSPAQLTGQFMKEITDVDTNKVDIFNPINDERVVFRYHSDTDKYKTHKYFISDNKSKTLFVMSLKSPSDSWDSSWKVGDVVFKQVALLPWDLL